MQKFVLGILVQLIENEKVQDFLLKVVDRLAEVLFPKLAAIIPTAVGSAVKAAVDEIVEKTPALQGVVDVVKTTDAAIDSVADIFNNVPIIGNILKGFGI